MAQSNSNSFIENTLTTNIKKAFPNVKIYKNTSKEITYLNFSIDLQNGAIRKFVISISNGSLNPHAKYQNSFTIQLFTDDKLNEYVKELLDTNNKINGIEIKYSTFPDVNNREREHGKLTMRIVEPNIETLKKRIEAIIENINENINSAIEEEDAENSDDEEENVEYDLDDTQVSVPVPVAPATMIPTIPTTTPSFANAVKTIPNPIKVKANISLNSTDFPELPTIVEKHEPTNTATLINTRSQPDFDIIESDNELDNEEDNKKPKVIPNTIMSDSENKHLMSEKSILENNNKTNNETYVLLIKRLFDTILFDTMDNSDIAKQLTILTKMSECLKTKKDIESKLSIINSQLEEKVKSSVAKAQVAEAQVAEAQVGTIVNANSESESIQVVEKSAINEFRPIVAGEAW
jgi:hypothetical protein